MKKISQIIAYSVLGLIVVGLILCSIIKLDFKPSVQVPQTEIIGKVQISATDGTSKVDSNNENINIEKFSKEFNNAFKLTILYSVFSGKMGNEAKVDDVDSLPSLTGYKVEFIYNDEYTLKVNSKEVPVADNSSTMVKYNRVIFTVTEGAGLGNADLYFVINGQSKYYKVSTIANFDKLYEHISNIAMFAE